MSQDLGRRLLLGGRDKFRNGESALDFDVCFTHRASYFLCSDDARSAVHQIVRYVIDRDLDEGVLYCLMALWVVRIITRKPLVVSISEVFTKDSINPSMREVSWPCLHS